jgi:membrane protein DedA with SNARE-associated domain
MPWPRFLLFNALGGIVWASLYGMGGYLLGNNIQRFTGLVGRITIVLAALLILVLLVVLRRNEHRLEEEAEKAFPGSLDAY